MMPLRTLLNIQKNIYLFNGRGNSREYPMCSLIRVASSEDQTPHERSFGGVKRVFRGFDNWHET